MPNDPGQLCDKLICFWQIFRPMFNEIQRKRATSLSVQDAYVYIEAIVDRLLEMLHYRSAAIKSR